MQYDPDVAFDADFTGIDVFQGQDAIRDFLGSGNPVIGRDFIGPEVQSVMRVRRCGWMNAQQMGAYLLSEARKNGCDTVSPASVTGVKLDALTGRVCGVDLQSKGETVTIDCDNFVNCAGPFVQQAHRLIPGSLEFPVENEVHSKTILKDVADVVPGVAPMVSLLKIPFKHHNNLLHS